MQSLLCRNSFFLLAKSFFQSRVVVVAKLGCSTISAADKRALGDATSNFWIRFLD